MRYLKTAALGRAARYTGGLSALTFLKVVTFQEVTPEANRLIGPVASRICRLEGMEAHARACDWRLRRFHALTPGTSAGAAALPGPARSRGTSA